MIESVYAGTTEKQAEYQVSGRRPPKNVRQAGYFTGDFRIYIEDYVHTFTHWLAEQDHSARCVAVLVGEFAKSEHSREVYAYGAVVAENAWLDGRIEMTSEIWKQVYETIKEYFPDGEIVGWFYGGTSFTDKEREQLRQVHLDYFAGTDRILMLYDFLEREEEFFRYENDEMSQQTGFYIYYEKNAEMQSYMIDKKQGRDFREQVEVLEVREMGN
ncbi:MAG: LysM domain-containing protein, partial [Lachnospiraceae bacterium]|nr:LysM domain-containing protein [Lachnospiraceae bacterium]